MKTTKMPDMGGELLGSDFAPDVLTGFSRMVAAIVSLEFSYLELSREVASAKTELKELSARLEASHESA